MLRPNLSKRRRKNNRYLSRPTQWSEFASQPKLSETWIPRNLNTFTISTLDPFINKGEISDSLCRKSRIISLVFLKCSSWFEHHVTKFRISLRYTDSSQREISLETVVSSANLTMRQSSEVETQSWINNEYIFGDNTHSWAESVFKISYSEMLAPIFTTCGRFVKKSNIQVHSEVPMPNAKCITNSFSGKIVLNAELKSMKSMRT